jgi:hypothetical protein
VIIMSASPDPTNDEAAGKGRFKRLHFRQEAFYGLMVIG